MAPLLHVPKRTSNRPVRFAQVLLFLAAGCALPALLKAQDQVPVTEPVTVTDTVLFLDAVDKETVTTTDTVKVVPLIAVAAPVVFYSAGSLGFGSVAAGQTATQSIDVSAIGEAPLTLSSAVISQSSAFTVGAISCTNGATSLPTTLPAGGVCTFTISFLAPSGPAPSGTITFTDNAALSNLASTQAGSSFRQSVALSGAGSSAPAPPPPPAVVTVPITETVTVTDTPAFPDALDSETIKVTDAVTVKVIQQVTPIVTWVTPAAITYGTALSGTQLDATATYNGASVLGTFVYTPASGTVLGVGSQTLSVAFTPNDTIDYTTAAATVKLTVNPAPLTVTASNATRQYGQANPPFTGTITGLQNGDNITATYSTTATSSSPLGGYAITPALVDPGGKLGNYSVTSNNGTLTVSTAPLTVTASSQAKTYGQTVTFGSGSTLFTSSGLQNGETIGSVTLAVSGNGGAATAPVSGSPFTITPSAATGGTFTASNYVISYVPGTLTVTAAPLTVTASNATRQYGQANPTLSGAIIGLQNGDIITAMYSTNATPTSPVGSYAITPGMVDPNSKLPNYAMTVNSGTLTITQAGTLTGVVTSGTPALYGQMITFTATVTAASSGSSGTPTGTVTFYDGAAAFGTSTLNASGLAAYSTFVLPGGAGAQSITAVYSGDANFSPSTSGAILQTILTAPVVSLDPDAITFHSEDVNTTSAPMPVVLTNQGNATLTIAGVQITGGNNGDFSIVSNTCGSSLAALSSCTVSVVFSPRDTGTRTSSLSFTDNNDGLANSNQLVSLTGSALSVASANFSRPPIAAGNTIWFDSVLSAKTPRGPDGVKEMDLSNHTVNVYVTNGTITFTANNTTYNLPVPDAMITFTPAVTSATTTFDAVNNRWVTTVPSADLTRHMQQFDIPGEVFASGLAFPVPVGGLPGGITNVTWSAAFTTDTPGVTLSWEWGAAVYSTFTTDYNLLGVGVKSGDDGKGHCQWDGNGDRAATPENFKQYLVMGATADGPRDYAGDFTRDVGVVPAAMVVSITPIPVVFAAPQAANTTSSPMTVTIINIHQSMNVAIASVAVNGDFAVTALSGSCPTGTTGFTLAPGNSCAFSVTFAPTDLGTRTGQLIFTLGAIAGMSAADVPPPQKVDLVGTGAGGSAPIAALSQLSLNFGREENGTTSAPQTVMLVNAGGAPLSITSIGTVPSGDFAITSNTCGGSLAPAANCIVAVSFTPTTTGQRTGALTFTYDNNNLSGLSQTVNLTGKGTP